MRLFADDHFPRLAAQSGDLPRPWVMPLGLPRSHRDRLAALLAQALRALEPGLTIIQLRWAERRFFSSGRLMLPSSVLVWWRVNAVPVVDPQAVVLDGSRLTPGLALYDFDPPGSLPSEAWLGPLKMGVLHRIQDRLLDERPIAAHEEISDAIRALSAKLISPIDVVDAAEAMIEVETQGAGLEAAEAEAVGRVIAGRFARGPADAAVRALVAVSRGEDLGDEGREVLRIAGLADAGGPMPLLDLLRDETTLRRTVLRIATQRGLGAPLAELAPGLIPNERAPSAQTQIDVAPPQAPGTQMETKTPGPLKPHSAVIKEALDHANRSDVDGASRILLRALQQREDSTWERDDLVLAGSLLFNAGTSEDVRRGQSMDAAKLTRIATLYEAAGDLYERGKFAQAAVHVLDRAAQIHGLLYEWSAAEALYERGRALAAASGDNPGLASCLNGRAEMRSRMGRWQEAVADAEESAKLFRELHLHTGEGAALRNMGDIRMHLGDLDGARDGYNAALVAFEEAKNPIGKVATLVSLGKLLQVRGELKTARETFEQALFLCRERGIQHTEAQVHQALGELSLERQERLRAREAYEEAATLYHELGDRHGEATVLERIGDVRTSMNELTLAREAYDVTLSLVRELRSPLWEAAVLKKRAVVAAESGDLDGALRDYEEAKHLYETLSDRAAEAHILLQMGQIEYHRKQWDASRRWYENAVDCFREIDDHEKLSDALLMVAATLHQAKRYDEAKQIAAKGLDVARAISSDRRITNITSLLITIDNLRRQERALDDLESTTTDAKSGPPSKLE